MGAIAGEQNQIVCSCAGVGANPTTTADAATHARVRGRCVASMMRRGRNAVTAARFALTITDGSSRRVRRTKRLFCLATTPEIKVIGPVGCPPISFREIQSRHRDRNANCYYR
jgi:hypothetical protein